MNFTGARGVSVPTRGRNRRSALNLREPICQRPSRRRAPRGPRRRARPNAHPHLVDVDRCVDPDGSTCIYSVTGELFFASDRELIDAFAYAEDPPHVIIDMSRAHVWDASAVAALDAIEHHYARHDNGVQITGLNSHSHALHSTLSGQAAAAHS